MNVTLNNEKYVSGDTIEALVEAAVQAAGEEIAAKERGKRLKAHQEFSQKFAEYEELLSYEQKRAQENQIAVDSLTNLESGRIQDMINGLVDQSNKRFSRLRFAIRIISIFIAVAPLATVLSMYTAGSENTNNLIGSLIIAFLAGSAAMDRPGAWLSKSIQRYLDSIVRQRLIDISRVDLSNRLNLSWKDGVSLWVLEEDPL
jgi:hypothetical protein